MGICTDVKKAMTGCRIIHRQALVTKNMPKELHMVLDEAVKIVNLIKSCNINDHLLSIYFNNMGTHLQSLCSKGACEMSEVLDYSV